MSFLIRAAIGWEAIQRKHALYLPESPKQNDGKNDHKLTFNDVPVDGFWSISVYNSQGFFEKNELNAYSLNNMTSKKNDDGSVDDSVRRLREGYTELHADR